MAAAVEAVQRGAVVGLPTDTVYGIGVDPLNEAAVGRLFEIKGRPSAKPVGLLAATLEQAKAVGDIDGAGEVLARAHWPGALTLIVRPKVILASWVGDTHRESVGIRVPDHHTARSLLEEVGPLAVTSANRSGGPEAMSELEAQAVFGEEVSVYIAGSSPGGQASTVADVTGSSVVVLREGPIEI